MRAPSRGVLLIAGLALVTACSGGSGGGHGAGAMPTGPVATTSASLAAANAAFAKTRTAILPSLAAVTRGASVLDAIDANATAGAKAKTTTAVPGAVGPVSAAQKALVGLTKQINAYAQAIQLLAAAEGTPGISPPQVAALAALVSAASTEVGVLRSIQSTQTAGWPAYNQLQTAQTLWQAQVNKDFFGTPADYSAKNAGAAYVASVHPLQSLLASERASLESGTAKLDTARAATDAALAGAAKAFS